MGLWEPNSGLAVADCVCVSPGRSAPLGSRVDGLGLRQERIRPILECPCRMGGGSMLIRLGYIVLQDTA